MKNSMKCNNQQKIRKNGHENDVNTNGNREVGKNIFREDFAIEWEDTSLKPIKHEREKSSFSPY